jgi:hypothetical protein
MSFDAWVVGFGIAGLIRTLHLAGDSVAYGAFLTVVAFDLWLLYRFFRLYAQATNTNPQNPLNPLNPVNPLNPN